MCRASGAVHLAEVKMVRRVSTFFLKLCLENQTLVCDLHGSVLWGQCLYRVEQEIERAVCVFLKFWTKKAKKPLDPSGTGRRISYGLE